MSTHARPSRPRRGLMPATTALFTAGLVALALTPPTGATASGTSSGTSSAGTSQDVGSITLAGIFRKRWKSLDSVRDEGSGLWSARAKDRETGAEYTWGSYHSEAEADSASQDYVDQRNNGVVDNPACKPPILC